MNTDSEELIIQVHFVNEVLNQIYRKNGFEVIPFDKKEKKVMIEICREDIVRLFKSVFESEDEARMAMNRFQSSNGLVLLFLVMLDNSQSNKLLSCSWNKIHHDVIKGVVNAY